MSFYYFFLFRGGQIHNRKFYYFFNPSNKKKLIEFSIKDLPHPPLVEKNNKKTCCFLGLFSLFGSKKNLKIFHQYHPHLPPTGAMNYHPTTTNH